MRFDEVMGQIVRAANLAVAIGNYEGIVAANRALIRIADRPALHCLQIWHNR